MLIMLKQNKKMT